MREVVFQERAEILERQLMPNTAYPLIHRSKNHPGSAGICYNQSIGYVLHVCSNFSSSPLSSKTSWKSCPNQPWGGHPTHTPLDHRNMSYLPGAPQLPSCPHPITVSISPEIGSLGTQAAHGWSLPCLFLIGALISCRL